MSVDDTRFVGALQSSYLIRAKGALLCTTLYRPRAQSV